MFYMGTGGPNSDPHSCPALTLAPPLSQPPQLSSFLSPFFLFLSRFVEGLDPRSCSFWQLWATLPGYRELYSSPPHEPLVCFSAELPVWLLIANGGANTESIKVFLNPEVLKIPPRSTMKSFLRDLGWMAGDFRQSTITVKELRRPHSSLPSHVFKNKSVAEP